MFEAIESGTNYYGEEIFKSAFGRRIVSYESSHPLGYSDVAPNANPIVFSNLLTYSQGRTHESYNAFFNYYGDQHGGFQGVDYGANLGKIFINQYDQIIYPVFMPVGTSWGDPDAPKKYGPRCITQQPIVSLPRRHIPEQNQEIIKSYQDHHQHLFYRMAPFMFFTIKMSCRLFQLTLMEH